MYKNHRSLGIIAMLTLCLAFVCVARASGQQTEPSQGKSANSTSDRFEFVVGSAVTVLLCFIPAYFSNRKARSAENKATSAEDKATSAQSKAEEAESKLAALKLGLLERDVIDEIRLLGEFLTRRDLKEDGDIERLLGSLRDLFDAKLLTIRAEIKSSTPPADFVSGFKAFQLQEQKR